MAIQLDCPACFQTLRVPDSTMGRVTVCPSCHAKWRVPQVTIPVAAAAVPSYESETQSFITPPPVAPASGSPFFVEEEEEAPEEPVNSRAVLARRNNRRMSRGWIGVILAFVAATIGVTGVWWWSNRQNVVRTATASVIANATLSKDLAQAETNVSSPDWGAMIASLKVNPVEMTEPTKMKVQFATNGDSLRLSLTPTSERMLVAVPTSAIAELQDAAVNAALLEAWKGSFSQSMTRMSKTIQDAVAGGVPPKLAAYGDVVGLEALAGPKGYHFIAAVGTTGYPCVFEDANHQLYFLVPAGTQSLAVMPRENVGARKSLPAKMRITATVK